MHPEILLLEKIDLSSAVERCAETLRQGRLLVLPTETVYGLAALASNADAVSRLCSQKRRRKGHALPLAVSGVEMARDYVAAFPPIAERLARRFWPGPLTLVVEASHSEGKLRTLPKSALQAIMPFDTCGLRAPQNKLLLRIIDAVGVPLVLTSANISGNPPAVTAREAEEALGENVDLIVDGGATTYGVSSTVAQIKGNEISILREGVISLQNLQDFSRKTTLFVCTANMCRSPVAEALARKFVADEIGVSPDKIEDHGIRIISAGIKAPISYPAPPTVCQFARKLFGFSLDSHRSQSLDSSMICNSDNIFTMESAQRQALCALYPERSKHIMTLDPSGHDVPDPFGKSATAYRDCFKLIESLIKARLNQILEINVPER